MKGKLPRIFAISCISALTACSNEAPTPPVCRTLDHLPPVSSPSAYCVVRIADRLLTISARQNQALRLPGGEIDPISEARCQVHQKVWQQTGFNAQIGELLRQNERAAYFHCDLQAGFSGAIEEFPVPGWVSDDVARITLSEPFQLNHQDWATPDEYVLMRDLFVQAKQPQDAD